MATKQSHAHKIATYIELYKKPPAPAYRDRPGWLDKKIDEAIQQKDNPKAIEAPEKIEEVKEIITPKGYTTKLGAHGIVKKDKFGRPRYWNEQGVEVTNFVKSN